MASDDAQRLSDLQAKWGRSWLIWRGRHGIHESGDWIASRINDTAGPDPTVMRDSAAALNEALHRQERMARRGVQPLTISDAAPDLSEAGPQ
ncbi:hypothetical protein [Actinoallomurus sp. CA-150999]|uniref:hypothetical protein n=1 Tax=Actinoallomurus sp. CA-150999 TaxID=3239887 RepID=UPI003D8C36DA